MTKVVNKKFSDYNTYIGRGSIFGNPYEIGKDGTREQVINRYREWFNHIIKDPFFRKEVLKLKNQTLGCFCKDKDGGGLDCHGDIIVEYLENL